jgi:hypothetical protein
MCIEDFCLAPTHARSVKQSGGNDEQCDGDDGGKSNEGRACKPARKLPGKNLACVLFYLFTFFFVLSTVAHTVQKPVFNKY